jgi:hypothetical protein
MANYNLTSQQIKDTYEQLAQVNDSNVLVDGLGNASPIVTASIIDFPTEVSRSAAAAGFGAGGGSATWPVSGTPSGIVSSSTQVNYLQLQNIPSGIVSSSAQIATNISGAFTATSASLADGIATNKSDITTKLNTSTFTSYSSSVSTRLTTDETNIATNTTNIATQTSRVDSLVATTSSYAKTNVNNSFSGTQNFVNIAVSGTASIAHVQTVTGSAVIIGEEFIILNAATPAARYAGIKIYDTGSGAPATASLEWDGVQDTWILMEESGDTAVILTGMTGSRGSEAFPTTNRVQKGGGFNQLTDSNISDDGSQVSITGPVSASTYYGDGSNLTGVESGLILGHGQDSLQSALTSVPALANANESIAIGNNSTTNSTGSIAIGVGSQIGTAANGAINIGSGSIAENSNASIAIGAGSNIGGNRSHAIAIGVNASANAEGVAIGPNANAVVPTSNDGNNVAIGNAALAEGRYTIAIGNDAKAYGSGANSRTIVIGHNANNIDSNRFNSVIIGADAQAYQNAVAIGDGAFGIESAVAVGRNSRTGDNYSVAIGASAVTNNQNCVVIGYNITSSANNQINIADKFKYDGVSAFKLLGEVTSSGGFYGTGPVKMVLSQSQDFIVTNTSTATSASRIIIGVREGSSYESTGLNSVLIGGGAGISSELKAAGTYNTVIGGATNQVTESIAGSVNATYATIIGGQTNRILNSGSSGAAQPAIVGGLANRIERTSLPFISNAGIFVGTGNRVSSQGSTIIGGSSNIISSSLGTTVNGYSSILGGRSNKIDALYDSAIIAGRFNSVSGSNAVVIGGATGSALHDRSVVIGGDSLQTTETDQVVVPQLLVSGQLYSPVFSASISSQTSSIDFNNGNFAVLTLTQPTHIGNPSNIKSGTTYTLVINSGSLVSTYGTSFKFAGGTYPTLSEGVDIVTMVSDGNYLYATGLANFS